MEEIEKIANQVDGNTIELISVDKRIKKLENNILDCIKEEIYRFKDDTPYTAKQYRDAVQRIKFLLEDK